MEHEFTLQILEILKRDFGKKADFIFKNSPLIQYLNIKTRSATRGSKSRSSFANLYAIYVLVEDYRNHGFEKNNKYENYEGAKFVNLLERQRRLPFGNKLQNHALNSRMNEEFKKYFPRVDFVPILRDPQTNRYWINENLLKIQDGRKTYNISKTITTIIANYIVVKQKSFQAFIETCERLKSIDQDNDQIISSFVETVLAPNADARMFEIVSYAILRYYYHDQIVYSLSGLIPRRLRRKKGFGACPEVDTFHFGFDPDNIQSENLKLFKTGRTNANDGGIDFVMRPLGRFFQVTETLDVKKYFLDIDKIERFPITFVVKTQSDIEDIRQKLREGAKRQYSVNAIVEKYMSCIEEVINIPVLVERFKEAQKQGYLRLILEEILTQSKVEFNLEDIE